MEEQNLKRIFVTGATGFIGAQLLKSLQKEGHQIHALYRNEGKTAAIKLPGVKLFKGDLLDEQALMKAMKGCHEVYHLAADATVWNRDKNHSHRYNVEGTLLLVRCAAASGIRRMVVSSTAGILGPSTGSAVHEKSPPPSSFFTAYEASKAEMERRLSEQHEDWPELVIVNPTRVYGPGLLSESNGVTRMIKQYVEGSWRLIPGDGKSPGNYVFVEDVVEGMKLAMAKGEAGERYVLGGENISYNELFRIVGELSGVKKRLFHLPLWLMLAAAGGMLGLAKLFGIRPLVVPGLVRKFSHNWIVSSDKAREKLGYHPLKFREGVVLTLNWLRSEQKA
ncbi:MAG: hypothetical protein CSA96_02240 [Bacteroidetes bacterium]|nr:MAG: hypothetical protein CSA96_02240 [Bacteroidota bacterium]